MKDFVIFADSACDISPEILKSWGIPFCSLTFRFDGEDKEYGNHDMSISEFYQKMRDGGVAKTAAVNTEAFREGFEAIAAEGKDILYLGFSSGLSNTFNAGRIAAEELSEKYPDSKVYACDTLCASLGEGLLVWLAAKKKLAGATIDEVRDYVEQNKLHLCHQFTVDDLMFLKRGGRVSATTAAIGTMLGIKPVMHVDNAGKLIKVGTARGRKGSLDALLDKMKATVTDTDLMFICHGDCIDDANYVAEKAKTELGVKEVFIGYTGVVIGSHSGPGTLAIFYLGSER